MIRRFGLLAALLAAGLLAGCGAATIIDLINDVDQNDQDFDTVAEVRDLLSRSWTVRSYTGSQVGAQTVPSAAEMVWHFDSTGTFAVTSSAPVSIGNGATRTYDEGGTWRVISPGGHSVGLTVTRRQGAAVAEDEQDEVTGVWSLDSETLVLTTSAVGPGTVRYVMEQ